MKAFFTFCIILFLSVPEFAQTISIVQDNIPEGGPHYYFHQRKVARTTDGTLMVTWTANDQVHYSIYDADFDTWSPPVAISSAGDRARESALAADEEGNIHCSWQQRDASGDPYQMYYSKYDGSSWSAPVTVSVNSAEDNTEGTIEVDHSGNVWVFFHSDGMGDGFEFIYARHSTDGGSTWTAGVDTLSSSGVLASSITVGRMAVAPGPGGKLVVVWHNGQPWDASRREIYANQYDGTSWQGDVMISDTTYSDRSANWYPGVAMDWDGNIYAIYSTNNNTSAADDSTRKLLLQKKAWADDWTSSTTSTIDISYQADFFSVSAVCDSNNIVHVIYQKDNRDYTDIFIDRLLYKYTADRGLTWSDAVIMNRSDYDASYGTIANRVRTAYGIDFAWRESYVPLLDNADTTAVIHGNIDYNTVVGVEDTEIPAGYEMISNYPNPFNPATTLNFSITETGNVTVQIYNILGTKVKTVVNEYLSNGTYNVHWNGTSDNGSLLPSGVYFVRMNTAKGTYTHKIMLLK